MDLTWLPDDRRFIATETEARKLKKRFEKVAVPTVKVDLIAHLNGMEEERERAVAAAFEDGRQAGLAETGDPDGGVQDTQAPTANDAEPGPAAATTYASGSLIEQVLELDAKALPSLLSAAIGRLGEIAGTHGWAAFAKDVYGWSPTARSVEQGLGMLMLAAFDSFGMKPAEKPRAITSDKTTGDE